MNKKSEIREALKNWLADRNDEISSEQIKDDLPLIREKVITSLQVTDLLLFIEQLRGCPVEIGEIKASNFQDLNHICEAFFEGVKSCA
jgi:acyl carrier protein